MLAIAYINRGHLDQDYVLHHFAMLRWRYISHSLAKKSEFTLLGFVGLLAMLYDFERAKLGHMSIGCSKGTQR